MNIIIKMITDNQIINKIVVDIETKDVILKKFLIIKNENNKLMIRGVNLKVFININFDDVDMIVNHHTKKLIFIAVR
jgi:hypothetical protein